MMNRNLRRVLTYVKMSLLFMVLGAIILYVAGLPLASYVIAQGRMVILKGAPGYPEGDSVELSEQFENQGTLDLSEIQIPELDTQYAMITCENLELSAPLYYGDSDVSLQYGVGQYSQGGFPGEGKPIMISGHDATFFAPLEKVAIGDVIIITTDYGRYEYKVTATAIADQSDQSAYDLTQGKEQLILYTCYPFGKVTGNRSKRFFVYCDRISTITEAVD